MVRPPHWVAHDGRRASGARGSAAESHSSEDLLPSRILSISTHIAPALPNLWALLWAKVDEGQRRAAAAHFNISPTHLPEVIAWMTAHMGHDLAWPNVFVTPDIARSFVRQVVTEPEELTLLGIGLHQLQIEAFRWAVREFGVGVPGVMQLILNGAPPVPGGEALGYEVLGDEEGHTHSWLCKGLEVDAFREFGIRPNAYGLLSSLDEACKVAAYADQHDSLATPVTWLPWLVLRYPLD